MKWSLYGLNRSPGLEAQWNVPETRGSFPRITGHFPGDAHGRRSEISGQLMLQYRSQINAWYKLIKCWTVFTWGVLGSYQIYLSLKPIAELVQHLLTSMGTGVRVPLGSISDTTRKLITVNNNYKLWFETKCIYPVLGGFGYFLLQTLKVE